MTVPAEQIQRLYENHLPLKPTELTIQSWGDIAFEVRIGGYQFLISAPEQGDKNGQEII